MKRTKLALKLLNPGDGRGCCCKRSACRKKYCECFRMNVSCTKACKCIGCGNTQEPFLLGIKSPAFDEDLNLNIPTQLRPIFEVKFKDNTFAKSNPKKDSKSKLPKSQKETEAAIIQIAPSKSENTINFTVKEQPVFLNFINNDVVHASIECMIAQAHDCTQNGLNDLQTQRMVLEEFDRCLVGILASMEITDEVTRQVFL